MGMISYAQNREDVILARAFPGRVGFYVDVGAAHPTSHSVTRWFYDQGWSGVNIEPLPHFFSLWAGARPRDVNLNAAASSAPGELTLYEHTGSIGMSTVDAASAGGLARAGAALAEHRVRAVTLREVWEEHVRGRVVDFLKVDAEGHERAVLEGADLKNHRPRAIVVEHTNVAEWEHLILEAGYTFTLYDGLNRYYVRNEEPDLIPLLSSPANCLDAYIPHEFAEEIEKLKAELASARATVAPAVVPTPAPRAGAAPFYAAGCEAAGWSRWPAVFARRLLRRIQRPFFFSLQGSVDELRSDLAAHRDAVAASAEARDDASRRFAELAARVEALSDANGRLQAELGAAVNSASLHPSGAAVALDELEWREREARAVARAEPLRVLFALSSGSQMYSGIGRAIIEMTKRLRDRVEYEFAIDDANGRNVDVLRKFCREQELPLHVGRAGSEPGDPGNTLLPGLIRGQKWDAIECVSFANVATHRAVLDGAGDVPIVYTPHYQPMWTVSCDREMTRNIERTHGDLLRRAALVACDTPWEWLMLRAAAGPGVDCAYLPLGFDPAEFTPGQRYRRPYLLFVGDQIEKRKRFPLTLEVFAEMLKLVPGLQLVVAGNKSDEMARDLPANIRNNCVFLGYVAEEELHRLYREASGLMLLSDYEAFGLPILESLASGTPVFLSRRPTVASLFDRYTGAVFIDDDAPPRMARRITDTLARGPEFIDQVLADRPRLEAELSWDRLAEKRYRAMLAAASQGHAGLRAVA